MLWCKCERGGSYSRTIGCCFCQIDLLDPQEQTLVARSEMFLDEQATDIHKQKLNYKLVYKPQEPGKIQTNHIKALQNASSLELGAMLHQLWIQALRQSSQEKPGLESCSPQSSFWAAGYLEAKTPEPEEQCLALCSAFTFQIKCIPSYMYLFGKKSFWHSKITLSVALSSFPLCVWLQHGSCTMFWYSFLLLCFCGLL